MNSTASSKTLSASEDYTLGPRIIQLVVIDQCKNNSGICLHGRCWHWKKQNNLCQQFKVAYNNSYRILNRLPMRCSASNKFANGNVNSCACVLRKSIYSLMTRIHASLNPIVNSIVRGDVYCTSALRIQWVSQLYNM